MTAPLEARPYGPGSSPEEIKAIKDRIYVYAPGVIMWHEVPVMSVYQLDLFEEKLGELTRDLESYRMLVDIRGSDPPNAEVRSKLKKVFTSQPKLRRAAVVTGKSVIMNTAALFVVRVFGMREFSVHMTFEEALAALEHAP